MTGVLYLLLIFFNFMFSTPVEQEYNSTTFSTLVGRENDSTTISPLVEEDNDSTTIAPNMEAASSNEPPSWLTIPDGLDFGASTSAFQIEGALKTHGREESFMEHFLMSMQENNGQIPELPEIASDSYHQYKQDVQVLKDIGLQFYRFSISWTRILPITGENPNPEGLQYYSDLLDELERAGIEPMIQLVHYDHPAVFEEFGGWQSELMIKLYKDYARVVFEHFAQRVKYFLTFNEPNVFCPFMDSPHARPEEMISMFPRSYICSHNVLKAHAEVYHLYHDEYNPEGNGRISINLQCNDFISQKANDQEAVDVAFAFACDWFGHPIYSESGDYSNILKQRINETMHLLGFEPSDMPTFEDYWIEKIRGSADFFSLTYFATHVVMSAPDDDKLRWVNFFIPPEARLMANFLPASDTEPDNSFSTAKGLRTVLRRIKEKYNNPPVYIVQNGYPTNDSNFNDIKRIKFIYAHVKEVINAVNEDECDVRGYFYWTLIDCIEFLGTLKSGTEFFGLASVDFKSHNFTRTLKRSAEWLRDVLSKNRLYLPVN